MPHPTEQLPVQHGPQHPPPWSSAYGGGATTGSNPLAPHSFAQPRRERRTTLGGVVRAWWSGRLRRLMPRGVPWTAVVLAAVLLAAWVVFADILVTPGVVVEYPGEAPSRDFAHDVVAWLVLMTTLGLGIAACQLVMATGGARMRWASVGLPVVSTVVTLWVVAGPGQPVPVIVGIVTVGVAASGVAVWAALVPRWRVHLAVAAGGLLLAQWAVMVWLGATEATGWVFLSSWLNLAFPLVLTIAIFAILAVALYAQRVHASADRIGSRLLLAPWVPIVAAIVVLAVVVLRMGPLRGVFNELDSYLWEWQPPSSWPHAVVAGAFTVWMVVRSGTRPVRSRGQGIVIVVVAAMAGMPILSFLVTFVATTISSDPAELDRVDQLGELLRLNMNLMSLSLAVVLVVVAVLPWSKRSTGRVGAIVALATTLPVQIWLLSRDVDLGIPRFVANPAQIAFVMLVIVLALAIWGAARGRDVVDRHLLLRLAVIPALTMHAGQLLPGVWRDDFEQVTIVVLSLAGLLLLGLPRSGTKEGAARALVVPFALQMALLGSVIVVRTMRAEADESLTAISVLYLTIPLSAMLCCRLEHASDAWTLGATSTVDLQTMRRPAPPTAVVSPLGGWGGAAGVSSGPTIPGPAPQGWPPHPQHPPGQQAPRR